MTAERCQWSHAGAAGAVALVLAGPLAAVLTATRRVLKSGYGIRDMVGALHIDIDRRKEELAFEQGKDAPPRGRVARFVSYAGLVVAGLGTVWLAFLEVGADVVLWVTAGSAATAILAGLVGSVRVRRENSTAGRSCGWDSGRARMANGR